MPMNMPVDISRRTTGGPSGSGRMVGGALDLEAMLNTRKKI